MALLAVGIAISAVAGARPASGTPKQRTHPGTVTSYTPPPESIATTVYVGKGPNPTPTKLRVAAAGRNGVWTVRASLGRRTIRSYQLPPLVSPHVPQRSMVYPLTFLWLPDESLPSVVVQTEQYANTETLAFFF